MANCNVFLICYLGLFCFINLTKGKEYAPDPSLEEIKKMDAQEGLPRGIKYRSRVNENRRYLDYIPQKDKNLIDNRGTDSDIGPAPVEKNSKSYKLDKPNSSSKPSGESKIFQVIQEPTEVALEKRQTDEEMEANAENPDEFEENNVIAEENELTLEKKIVTDIESESLSQKTNELNERSILNENEMVGRYEGIDTDSQRTSKLNEEFEQHILETSEINYQNFGELNEEIVLENEIQEMEDDSLSEKELEIARIESEEEEAETIPENEKEIEKFELNNQEQDAFNESWDDIIINEMHINQDEEHLYGENNEHSNSDKENVQESPDVYLDVEAPRFLKHYFYLEKDPETRVDPLPADYLDSACHLPPKTGFCKAAFRRFYYNSRTGECETFIYGGCGGNENNFQTIEECMKTCSQTEV